MTDHIGSHVLLQARPYQAEAIDRTLAAAERGVLRQLGVAATGLGKTVIFSMLAERMGCRTLVLAHRDELVSQAAAKVREVWPGVTVGIVKAGDDQVRAQVVVASVQTLARQRRLDRLVAAWHERSVLTAPVEPFGLVVVDEAHHTAADSYRRVLDAMPAEALVLGVTATPDRGDGKGLNDLFAEITWSYDLLWGIRSGYLADMRGLRVEVSTLDMGDVKVTHGDYNQGQAGAAMERAGAERFIVKAWQEHAAGRRTLVFTPTVAVAEMVAGEFQDVGVAAAWVSGDTPLDERRATLAAYGRGDVQVLVNCMVLTEGYDEPRTDCVVVARPTRSRALYTQMVGRGSRRHPDKGDCLVLDVVGASDEHSLVTIPSLFGLGEGYARRMGDGTGLASDVVQERDDELVRLGKLRAEEADLFRQVRTTGIAWVALHEPGDELRRYIRPLGRDGDGRPLPTVVLAQRPGDVWTAGLQLGDGSKQVLMREVPMETAQGVAEDYVRKQASHGALVNTDAPWRKRKPSPKQLAAAKKWRMTVDPAWTAGQLSEAMDAHIARVNARRKR